MRTFRSPAGCVPDGGPQPADAAPVHAGSAATAPVTTGLVIVGPVSAPTPVRERRGVLFYWDLTFDTTGARGRAQLAGGRPLDGGVGHLVMRRQIAYATREGLTKRAGAAFWRDDPGAMGPWGIVPNVLVVTALKLSHPMLLFVLMEANDLSIHGEGA
jgi:hypothetical protein